MDFYEKEPQFSDKTFEEKYEIYVEARKKALKETDEHNKDRSEEDKASCTTTVDFQIRHETSLNRETLVNRIREISVTKIEMLTKEQLAYLLGEE